MRHTGIIEITIIRNSLIYTIVYGFSQTNFGGKLKRFIIFDFILIECNYKYSLPILWHIRIFGSIHHFIKDCITEFFQTRFDNLKCTPAVMAAQVFDIFQEHHIGLPAVDYIGDIEKQSSARVVKSELFARNRKCLTREAGAKDIEFFRDFRFDGLLRYIAIRDFSEIFAICRLGIFVPFGREHALTAVAFQRYTKATYTGKQINESEIPSFHGIHLCQQSDGPAKQKKAQD